MARTAASARKAGQMFERLIANCLAALVDDGIDIRPKNGQKDRGDLGGVRHMGQRVVVQCKDYSGQDRIGVWLREVDEQRGHDDAGVGLVIAKRRGTADPLDQVVFMTVRDLVALLTGSRP